MNDLTIDDIVPDVASAIYTQNYSKKETIEGVTLISLINHVSEDGDFSELMYFNENGTITQLPHFKIAQINRSKLHSRSIKAWHVHFKQNEVWYISPSDHLLVGLWDVRRHSQTASKKMRVVLGGGNSQLLYIPKGVAHGCSNLTEQPIELFYFVDQTFDLRSPDERRISWNSLGADFWRQQRD